MPGMTKKPKRKSPVETFLALSDDEKSAAVREFDAPSEDGYGFGQLSPESRKLWQKAKRKRGRPKIGAGAAKVLVSVERGLLRRADAFAKREGISRSQLFARGLSALMETRRRAG
jgi:hypothetical protein